MDRFVSDKASLVRELITKIGELEESAFYINNQLDEKQQPTIMMPGNKLCIYWEISMVGVRLLENMY